VRSVHDSAAARHFNGFAVDFKLDRGHREMGMRFAPSAHRSLGPLGAQLIADRYT
jgi:hypothetical protein